MNITWNEGVIWMNLSWKGPPQPGQLPQTDAPKRKGGGVAQDRGTGRRRRPSAGSPRP
jgi:hypothetical protein